MTPARRPTYGHGHHRRDGLVPIHVTASKGGVARSRARVDRLVRHGRRAHPRDQRRRPSRRAPAGPVTINEGTGSPGTGTTATRSPSPSISSTRGVGAVVRPGPRQRRVVHDDDRRRRTTRQVSSSDGTRKLAVGTWALQVPGGVRVTGTSPARRHASTPRTCRRDRRPTPDTHAEANAVPTPKPTPKPTPSRPEADSGAHTEGHAQPTPKPTPKATPAPTPKATAKPTPKPTARPHASGDTEASIDVRFGRYDGDGKAVSHGQAAAPPTRPPARQPPGVIRRGGRGCDDGGQGGNGTPASGAAGSVHCSSGSLPPRLVRSCCCSWSGVAGAPRTRRSVATQPDVFKDPAPAGPVVAAAAVAASPFDEDAPLASARPVAKGAPVAATAPLDRSTATEARPEGACDGDDEGNDGERATRRRRQPPPRRQQRRDPRSSSLPSHPRASNASRSGTSGSGSAPSPTRCVRPNSVVSSAATRSRCSPRTKASSRSATPEGITGWIRRTAILGGAS